MTYGYGSLIEVRPTFWAPGCFFSLSFLLRDWTHTQNQEVYLTSPQGVASFHKPLTLRKKLERATAKQPTYCLHANSAEQSHAPRIIFHSHHAARRTWNPVEQAGEG